MLPMPPLLPQAFVEFRVVNTVFSGFNTSDCGYHSYAMAHNPGEVDFTVPVIGSTITWDHVDDGAKLFLGGNNNSRPLFIDKDGSLLGALGGGAGSSLLGIKTIGYDVTGSASLLLAQDASEPSCNFVTAFNGKVCTGQLYRTGSYVNIDMRNGGAPAKNPGLEQDVWAPIDVQRLSSPFAPYTPRNAITYRTNQNVGLVFPHFCIPFHSHSTMLLLDSYIGI